MLLNAFITPLGEAVPYIAHIITKFFVIKIKRNRKKQRRDDINFNDRY